MRMPLDEIEELRLNGRGYVSDPGLRVRIADGVRFKVAHYEYTSPPWKREGTAQMETG